MGYRKIRWSGPAGVTAGLVFSDERVTEIMGMANAYSVLSRYWPNSEARKMVHIFVSPSMPTWDAAFRFDFDAFTREQWKTT